MKKSRSRQLLGVIRWVLTLVVIVGIWLASVALVDRGAAKANRGAEEARQSLAEIAGQGMSGWWQAAREEARVIKLGMEPWPGPQGLAGARRSLEDRTKDPVIFDPGGVVVSRERRVVITTPDRSGALAAERSPDHVVAALGGASRFSGVYEDPLDRSLFIELAVPVSSPDGSPAAVLLLRSAITGGTMTTRLDGLSSMLREGMSIALVDPTGTAVDRSGGVIRGSPDFELPARLARGTGSSGFISYPGEGGVGRASGFAPLEDGWSLAVVSEAATFYPRPAAFTGRLLSAGPTRSAGILLGLILLVSTGAVVALGRRLASARGEVEESKRAFLAITGHELRTPLTVIRGYSQTLSARWDSMKSPQRKEILDTIYQHARQLEQQIERLIVGAQLEAGLGGGVVLRSVDVTALLGRAVDHHQSLTKIHEITLDTEPELTAKADPKALEQTLDQILENARKYSPAGGPISVVARRSGGRVEITVEDRGVGLPSDFSAIFEKFTQGEAVDTRVHDEGGVGLGLYIARTHLKAMGGGIKASPVDAGGARFTAWVKAA